MKKKLSLQQKKLITQKKEILYSLLLDECKDYQICEEALNIIYDIIGDVDLTIVQNISTDIKLIATTLNNEDNIRAVVNVSKYYLLHDGGKLAETVKIRARPDVLTTKTLALDVGKSLEAFLLIDIYDEDYFLDKEELKDIFDLLGLIVRINILEKERTVAFKVDNLTRICTRDSLIEDIKGILDSKIVEHNFEIHIAVLSISNAEKMNIVKGGDYMDQVLRSIARVLSNTLSGGYVYRIGGMKFAALVKKDLQDTVLSMQSVLEKLHSIDDDLDYLVGVSSLQDDPYKTLFYAETQLKDSELEVNEVNILLEEKEDELYAFNNLKQEKVIVAFSEDVIELEEPRKEPVTFVADIDSDGVDDVIIEDSMPQEEENVQRRSPESEEEDEDFDFSDITLDAGFDDE